MLLSLAHHAHHAHHLTSAVAALVLAGATATGLAVSPVTRATPRVTVTHVVEVPAAAHTPSAATPAASLDPTTDMRIGVTVPTRDEILAQCAQAGLTVECVSAGLR